MVGPMPEAWPLLLDRQQLCAYLHLPEDLVFKILPVEAISLGEGILRWNRQQVDEWAKKLRSEPKPLSASEKRKAQRVEKKAKFDQDMIELKVRMAVNDVRRWTKNLNKQMDKPAEYRNISDIDRRMAFRELAIAATLLTVHGERHKIIFENIEATFYRVEGRTLHPELSKQPAAIRAKLIMEFAREELPNIVALVPSAGERPPLRRSPGRR